MIIRSLVNNCGLRQLGFFCDQVCTPESDPVKLKVGVVLDAVFRCVCVLLTHRRSQCQMTTPAWTQNIGSSTALSEHSSALLSSLQNVRLLL